MKTRRLNISDNVLLRLRKIRESLAGVHLDDEEMSKVTGGCGGICYVSCSFHCEVTCSGSCMLTNEWITGMGPDLRCLLLPPQNGTDWDVVIRAK